TAPTAGLGDTSPTPVRASSTALRMCCSSMVIRSERIFHRVRLNPPRRHREELVIRFEAEMTDPPRPPRPRPARRLRIDSGGRACWANALRRMDLQAQARAQA